MERRDCCEVIRKMMEHLPEEKKEFKADLEWNLEDASFKAPEETLQWNRTMQTLEKHIPKPSEDWEYEMLSIFTTRSINELKEMVESNK
jgi:hypothetical protein